MLIAGIDAPEPFYTALISGKPQEVCDAEAATSLEFFGRALARVVAGREDEARADFERAEAELGDVCRIELAHLDIRQRRSVRKAKSVASAIAERVESPGRLAARAWHVLGLAEGKLRNHAAAIDALLRASEMYRELDMRLARAHVFDTLGALEAARGRLDLALGRYAMSLVDKSLLHDSFGMALTLGSIGRVHLRAGRYFDAIDCFQRDLEISTDIGDVRGVTRMHADLGQAYIGLENFAAARDELSQCLALANANGLTDLAFFARKDLVLLLASRGDFKEAQAEFEKAASLLPKDGEPYLSHLLTAAEGELLLAQDSSKAIDLLQSAAEGFREAQLPDFEIPTRVSLARALVGQNCKRMAEQCLLRGIRLAKKEGYSRYLTVLNEAMTALDLVESAVEEVTREIATDDQDSEGAYVIREKLGEGAFGQVFRAYDSNRGREVAIKRLHTERLYDVRRRKRVIESIHLEIEAASRIRHPGVSRVFATGQEPNGCYYVVQEFVAGTALRRQMPKRAEADPALVLSQVERISEALHALHEANVVHRDVKPENVIMRTDGMPVLIDFGIAWMPNLGGRHCDAIAGTVQYMAPEQALGRRIDRRADIYSLGVLTFEWLCGLRPIRPHGTSFEEMARDIATRPAPSVSEFRPEVHGEIVKLVSQMLAKKPHARPKSAAAVAEQCRTIVADLLS